ncbi:MAG: hemerythrin domain-containing protein [Candidatus Omnitrophica bacterium]|nr:hemerythrin domain-containing protein [Candidatus Omnitrophota bacterium]
MKLAGLLMIEHRLIERMISVIDEEVDAIRAGKKADALFADTVVEFMRIYADKCHHGKEENVLFRELQRKKISAAHKRTMDELVTEHAAGREIVKGLALAGRYDGNRREGNLTGVIKGLERIVKFYPEHIEKEEKYFIVEVMNYFSGKEQDDMLNEFREYDRKLIHAKYQDVVGKMEKDHSSVLEHCQSSVTAEQDRFRADDEPCDAGMTGK